MNMAENTEVTEESNGQFLQEEELTVDHQDETEIEVSNEDADVQTSEGEAVKGDENEDEIEEEVITLGEDSPPPPKTNPAPEFVKDLRRITRKQGERIKELEALLGQQSPPTVKPVELRKPTLESCEFDDELFEKELESYFSKKRQIDEENARKAEEERRIADEWAAKLNDLEVKKSQLKVSDYDQCEFICQQKLSPTQQGIIVEGAENAAHIFYVLGKYPNELNRLAEIKNPVKFAYEVAKLESKKIVNPVRKSPPTPDRKVTGTIGTSSDAIEKRLFDEAMITRDFTKVVQFRQANKK